MFRRGTCRIPASFHDVASAFVSRSWGAGYAVLFVGIALLASPRTTLAQRRGGGGAGAGDRPSSSVICIYDCSNRQGLNSEDSLKNFRRFLAVQATAEQRAAFNKIAQYTQAASDQLKNFRESPPKVAASLSQTDSGLADRQAAFDQSIERVRAGNQNFLSSFSDAQKTSLKEVTTKLAKADSELDKEIKTLDQLFRAPNADRTQIFNSAAGVDKELANFQNEQLALGREMGILLDSDTNGLVFNLPGVTNSFTVADQTVSIPSSASVSRTSTENSRDLFRLQIAADLSDVQQSMTEILRSSLNRSPLCGERIEVQRAWLAPAIPATLVIAQVHYERWMCSLASGRGIAGQRDSRVIATSDGIIEVKLTPSIAPDTGMVLAPEITHVNAEGFLRDSLRSGELGIALRDQIAASVLSVMKEAADLKTILPPVAQQSATIQKAKFQDAGADHLNLLLEGQIQFSDAQTQQFADQLKQRLAARQSTAP
jgi:hypothetical protein